MLVAAIVFAVLMVGFGVVAVATGSEGFGYAALTFFFLALIVGLVSLNVHTASKHLTGYIYSSSDRFGYTTAHIRYSQNAGADVQPEFCVKTDSDAGRAIQKYEGTETKVAVDIPSYFYFSNNPFACGTTNMTIKEEAK